MYLTAQRVRHQQGQEGINSYLYLHGRIWDVPPPEIPDDDPGELAYSTESAVPPGGNQVRSYLDIVAPDLTRWNEIHHAFITFLAWAQEQPLPWVGIAGQCMFRFGLEFGLVSSWRGELASLYRTAHQLHDAMDPERDRDDPEPA